MPDTTELPRPRGPLSEAVVATLRHGDPPPPAVSAADAFGADLAVALHTCYELHYHGFRGVSPDWEWSPELLAFRGGLERVFLAGLRDAAAGGDDVSGALDGLLVETVPGTGVSHFLRDKGEWWQLREYVTHRSVYHHKEADPHAWLIPRLRGTAKAALWPWSSTSSAAATASGYTRRSTPACYARPACTTATCTTSTTCRPRSSRWST